MSTITLRKLPLFTGLLLLGALTIAAAPQDETEGEAEAEEQAPAQPRSRRPVLAPGQAAPAAPAAPVPVVPRPDEEEEEPAEPAAPLEFRDGPSLPAAASAKEPEEEEASTAVISNPAEVQYRVRRGNFHYSLAVRPGAPKPGEPVELSWTINEQLLIPDPYLGDRKPLEDVGLVAKITGPEPERVYKVHADRRPGRFGHHFTPSAPGVYKVALSREDGNRAIQVELSIPVGSPPLPASRDLEVRMIPASAPDSFQQQMRELGKRWMELDRDAGTPHAERARERLVRFAKELAEGAPEGRRAPFDSLATSLEALPLESREATLSGMEEVNFNSCLRCHAAGRLEFAKDVSKWPAFTPNDELTPPTVRQTGAPSGRRGPIVPGQGQK